MIFKNLKNIKITKKLKIISVVLFSLMIFQVVVIVISVFTSKTIRTMISGESLWSKLHKSSTQNLVYYINSKDEDYYLRYLREYELQENFRKGRDGLVKETRDRKELVHYFKSVGMNENDLNYTYYILPLFLNGNKLAPVLKIWKNVDDVRDKLHQKALYVHNEYKNKKDLTLEEKNRVLEYIYKEDFNVFHTDETFSIRLGHIARNVENFIASTLLSVFAFVIFTVLYISSSLIKSLKTSLHAIKKSINLAVSGDLNANVEVSPEHDLHEINTSLQEMYKSFKNQLAGRINAEEAESRLAVLGDAMPQMVCIKKPTNEVEFLNSKVWDYFGIEHRIASLVNIYENCHPDDYEPARVHYETAIKEKKTSVSEIRLKDKNGNYNWFLSRFEPSLNARGDIIRWYGSYTDIQDQKISAIELEKAVKVRDQFLSIASHELKTPLTSMKLRADMRKKMLERNQVSRLDGEFVSKMILDDSKQVNRLIKLVDDMLDISRIGQGKIQISPSNVDLIEIVSDITDKFLIEFEANNAKLFIKLDTSIRGEWDPFKMEQVLTNLLTNSLKYGNGSDVEVRCYERDGVIRLEVQDWGHGIDKRNLSKIFELFERVNASNSIAGLGLGLYIVKYIVEAHNGQIWAESELGEGTTFFIEFRR